MRWNEEEWVEVAAEAEARVPAYVHVVPDLELRRVINPHILISICIFSSPFTLYRPMSKEVERWENVGDGILMKRSKLGKYPCTLTAHHCSGLRLSFSADHDVQMNDATGDRDKSIKAEPTPGARLKTYQDRPT